MYEPWCITYKPFVVLYRVTYLPKSSRQSPLSQPANFTNSWHLATTMLFQCSAVPVRNSTLYTGTSFFFRKLMLLQILWNMSVAKQRNTFSLTQVQCLLIRHFFIFLLFLLRIYVWLVSRITASICLGLVFRHMYTVR